MKQEPQTIGQIEANNVARLTGLNIHPDPAHRSRYELQLARTWGAGGSDAWEVGQPRCKVCKSVIDPTPFRINCFDNEMSFAITCCDKCMDLAREHFDGEKSAHATISLTPKWDSDCPPKTRDAIIGHLPPAIDKAAFKRFTAWRPFDRKGLAARGPSGAGKTTALWALARELEREGFNPIVLTGVELGRILSKAARDIEAVDWLCRARVLMIDDIGKEKLTSAMAALLWEVLDKRYGLGLPLILTSRFTGDELKQRFGEEYLGEDIIRRIRELCSGVSFSIPESINQQ